MRRLLATGAALVTVVGVGAVAAPTANAGVNPTAIIVSALNGCRPSTTSVVGNPGDSFSILVRSGCTAATVGATGVSPADFYVVGTGSVTITLGAVGSGSFVLDSFGATGISSETITVTITGDPVADPTFHDDLQQVGVPASGSCDDVDIEVGHYPGAPIGGWSKSWAWWINDGKGGPVCTRELEELSDGTIVLIG